MAITNAKGIFFKLLQIQSMCLSRLGQDYVCYLVGDTFYAQIDPR